MITDETPVEVPRLARDGWRAVLTTVIGMLVGFLVQVGYAFVVVRLDLPVRMFMLQMVYLLCFALVLFLLYQLITWRIFAPLDAAELQQLARATTPRTRRARWLELVLGSGPKSFSLTAAVIALAVALAVALVPALRGEPLLIGLSLLVVASSWTMVVFAYALKYLRLNVERGGLEFPAADHGLVWRDYFYLAVQVSTTFSTSDVEVTSTRMRGTVTAQSIVAFVFNTVIVALLVSALLTFV